MEDRLSLAYRIKGVPLLSLVSTLTLPTSFPLNFIFKNLVPNLVAHYTSDFKGLDTSAEEYIILAHIWSEIRKIGSASGDTIPLQFGARMLNIEREHSHMTAEAWSFWVLVIALVFQTFIFPYFQFLFLLFDSPLIPTVSTTRHFNPIEDY